MFVIHLFEHGFGGFDDVVFAFDGHAYAGHVGGQQGGYLTVVSEADYTH
jgi:hypothetical protein